MSNIECFVASDVTDIFDMAWAELNVAHRCLDLLMEVGTQYYAINLHN
jgi:hypothetical protein